MLTFYVYMLKCSDGSYYIGHTNDLNKRLSEHEHRKYSGYTSSRLPVELVFAETFSTRIEAVVAERQIKKWTRRKKEMLVKEGWDGMASFHKKNGSRS